MILPYFDALKACVNKHLPKFSYIDLYNRQSEQALLGQEWPFGFPCLLVEFGTITFHANNPNPTADTNIILHVVTMLYDTDTSTSARNFYQLMQQVSKLFNDFSFVVIDQEGTSIGYGGGNFELAEIIPDNNHNNLIVWKLNYKTKLLQTAILEKQQLTIGYILRKGYTYTKPDHQLN